MYIQAYSYVGMCFETLMGLCSYSNMTIRQISYSDDSNRVSRLTVVSREAKKKQHACASSGPRDHYSELFTWMAALKF